MRRGSGCIAAAVLATACGGGAPPDAVVGSELPAVSVTISPPSASVVPGGGMQFSATLLGTPDLHVIWSVAEGAAGGSVDGQGHYTAPATEGSFHVTARSRADPGRSAIASVLVRKTEPVGVPASSPEDLVDHGGPVAASTRTFALWWGDAHAFAADSRPVLEDLLTGLGGSAYLGIATQYLRGAQVASSFGGSLFDPSAPPADDPSPGVIVQAACAALEKNGIAQRPGDLVFVNTSNFPKFASGVRSYCAWHYWGQCRAGEILVAYVPNAAGTDCDARRDFCGTGFSPSTTSRVTLAAHELMEAITDPFVTAWYMGATREIADKCGEPACVPLSTGTFELPLQYSNAAHGCVDH